MEFDSVVQSRRSIRRYAAGEVTGAQIKELLESARLCQSAKNRQPWLFLPLRGEMKDTVANIMLNPSAAQVDAETPYGNSSHYTARVILQADTLILALREPDDDWFVPDVISIGAAIEHICLKATDMGLGALWIGDTVYTEDEIKQAVGCERLELLAAIAVGVPAESPGPRPRKTLDAITLAVGGKRLGE